MTTLLLCTVYLFLSITSIVHKSATYDEGIILASGLRFLEKGDNLVNQENPPLAKSILAFPLFLAGAVLPEDSPDLYNSYSMGPEFEYGRTFLYGINTPEQILFLSRTVNIVLTLVAGIALYLALGMFFSRWYSLGGMAVFLFSPTVIANGRLGTVDMAVTLFSFLTCLCLFKTLRDKSLADSVLTGISLGAAMASKFTAVLLAPAIVLQLAIFYILVRDKNKSRDTVFLLSASSIIIAVALFTVNIFYGFSGFGTTLQSLNPLSPTLSKISDVGFMKYLPIPLPVDYLRGFDIVAFNQAGLPNVFLGKFYPGGKSWWYYYAVVVALKTPVPVLILFLIGLFLLSRRFYRKWYFWFWTLFPLIIFLNFSFIASRQLGIRYILPVCPFLCIPVIYVIRGLAMKKRRLFTILASLLLASTMADAVLVYPHYLAYFNFIAGGPEGGKKYLADSNLDWGQDLPALKIWMEQHNSPPVFLIYHGQADPEYYGIVNSENPEFIAVSVTWMYMLKDNDYYRRLFSREPVANAGYSIYIYETPKK